MYSLYSFEDRHCLHFLVCAKTPGCKNLVTTTYNTSDGSVSEGREGGRVGERREWYYYYNC